MSSPHEPDDTGGWAPKSIDDVLAGVVAEAGRRRARRRHQAIGAGGVLVAVALVAAVLVAGSRSGKPSGNLADGPTTTAASAPNQPGEGQGSTTIAGRRPDTSVQLVSYHSASDFLTEVKKEALAEVTPYGLASSGRSYPEALATTGASVVPPQAAGAPAAATARAAGPADDTAGAAQAHSTTNNQEAGVDEPDQVKTDGRYLYAMENGKLRIVDVTASQPRVVANLDLSTGQQAVGNQLFLAGNRVLVLGDAFVGIPFPGGVANDLAIAPAPLQQAQTTVVVVAVDDPARPSVVKRLTLDGSYLSARMVGGIVRLVQRSSPRLPWVYPSDGSAAAQASALAANKRTIQASTAADWLPDGAAPDRAYHTQVASGLDTVTVRSIDPAQASAGPAVTVVSSAETVYASTTSLYVATTDYANTAAFQQSKTPPKPARTALHKFDISDPATARYVGSGDVLGTAINQYALSEQGDALRIATTTGNPTPPPGESFPSPDGYPEGSSQSLVTVLRPSGNLLVEVGSVTGLGRGERIYGVRFIGDRGYVVTFRQLDPLYVIDLSDPAHPRLSGELELTGYSAYLHPVGPGRLLGLGASADANGRRTGVQVSLFDVSDPAHPKKLAGASLPQAYSQAEQDFHAFLYWAPTGLALIPVSAPNRPAGQTAVGFTVTDRAVTELGEIAMPATAASSGYSPGIDRSVVVGSRVFSVAMNGVLASDLASLQAGGFAPFPA